MRKGNKTAMYLDSKMKHSSDTNSPKTMSPSVDLATLRDVEEGEVEHRMNTYDFEQIQKMFNETSEKNLAAIDEKMKIADDKNRNGLRKIVQEELQAAKSWSILERVSYLFYVLLYVYGILFVAIGILDIGWSWGGGKFMWSWGAETIHSQVGSLVKSVISKSGK
ncbi:hypothetical protein V500_07460 [Pseudogymnoascus sp. VKM F-4518 (FW-2643)]|nr:hypothetical protein V500_07460 [Pseudogymnoascus sp. VKM F-4518 (FW-2643)]